MSWKRSRPLRPMNGSPPSSSSRPGASPITISAGFEGPEPTTTRWRVSQSTQRVHVGSSAKSRLISVNEDTRHACPNTAKYLPRDGARTLGPLIGRDLLVALAAQEDDLVTGRHGVIAAVDHQHVHGDHAGEGITLRVDKDLGTRVEETTGIAVGVAEGNGGDRGGCLQRPATLVARSLPRVGATHGDDMG